MFFKNSFICLDFYPTIFMRENGSFHLRKNIERKNYINHPTVEQPIFSNMEIDDLILKLEFSGKQIVGWIPSFWFVQASFLSFWLFSHFSITCLSFTLNNYKSDISYLNSIKKSRVSIFRDHALTFKLVTQSEILYFSSSSQ